MIAFIHLIKEMYAEVMTCLLDQGALAENLFVTMELYQSLL